MPVTVATAEGDNVTLMLSATRETRQGNSSVVRFDWDNPAVTFSQIISAVGEIPIPPYLNRSTEEADSTDYQTVYSRIEGSVAAPTAGLHFTDEVFAGIDRRGIPRRELTLHVGAGTFQPVKSESIGDHAMHAEFIAVPLKLLRELRDTTRRIIAVGTTSVRDINKDTVDFQPNFDETEREPVVLPARFPNLLVNGTTGIAVGMATNIPPHNLRETINAVVKIIDNIVEEDRETAMEELLEIVKGPDFPTGATILGTRGIEEAYRTGRGKIRVRAVTNIETLPNGKSRIVVTELPYLVNKARLIEKIAELVRDKKIDGITDLNDHSSREGMRICIDLRKDANANVILNLLYKHTQLQDTFGVIMLSLVPNHGSMEPKVLNLKEMLEYYLEHQENVVRRRTQYDLNKAQERAHILEGLLKALDNIDEVIRIIRGSRNVQIAKQELIERFELTDVQAQAIVDMRLRALTGLEREKLEAEYAELMEKIRKFQAILADRKLLLRVIREEILAIAEKYGDDRKTSIGYDVYDISTEDLIPRENTVIAMTKLGYIKRMTVDNFRSQNRGGRGIKGMQTIEE